MSTRLRRRFASAGSEAGYSLVEVMVAIMLLSIATIPMVSMFDAGLRSANLGSKYDQARTLAKKQVELVNGLPYATVRTNFPNAPCTFDAGGKCLASDRTDPSGNFNSFRYTIKKQYVAHNAAGDGFDDTSASSGMMQVTVTVGWGGAAFNEKTYTTTVLKAK